MRAFRNLVGGRLVPSSAHYGVINPSTGQVFAQAPSSASPEISDAVAAAKAAFPSWAATPLEERQAVLLAAKEALSAPDVAQEIAQVLVQEQGKSLGAARGEMAGLAAYLGAYGRMPLNFERVLKESPSETVVQVQRPLGVVAGICPWNFPALMAGWKLAEALVCGNTIVLKPSPYTPLSTLLIGEALLPVLPPGVANIISGDDQCGADLVTHADVAKISFTGSTRTGKLIHQSASGTLKRLTLELGGNDPAIVLADADPLAVAKQIFNSAFANCGQVCIAVKRVYVHQSIFPAVIDGLVAAAAESKLGDGMETGVTMGPLNNEAQLKIVEQLVDDVRAAGATVHCGGAREPRNGFFYPPTIVSGVGDDARIVQTEQFGPCLPVLSFTDVDQAVASANRSPYGLGASVWSANPEVAARVARRLDAGTVWVNEHMRLEPDVLFGGAKQSGVGAQMGSGTVDGNTQASVIRIPKSG